MIARRPGRPEHRHRLRKLGEHRGGAAYPRKQFVEASGCSPSFRRRVGVRSAGRRAIIPNTPRPRRSAVRWPERVTRVITGGGPGTMEAVNRGASEAGGNLRRAGYRVALRAAALNDWVDIGINFRLLLRPQDDVRQVRQAFVIMPGGFGTMDELFESLTLVQTRKVTRFPVILYGTAYWQGLLDWFRSSVLPRRQDQRSGPGPAHGHRLGGRDRGPGDRVRAEHSVQANAERLAHNADDAQVMAAVCVFCASSERIDPRYILLAEEARVRAGPRRPYAGVGGARISMMGAVTRAARAGGARTVGVMPQALIDIEIGDLDSDELIIVDTMRERKRIMDERADAFVALPGGIGTLEELFEVWNAATIGLNDKPIFVLDPDGFYRPLWTYLESLVDPASSARRRSDTCVEYRRWTRSSPLSKARDAAPRRRIGGLFCGTEGDVPRSRGADTVPVRAARDHRGRRACSRWRCTCCPRESRSPRRPRTCARGSRCRITSLRPEDIVSARLPVALRVTASPRPPAAGPAHRRAARARRRDRSAPRARAVHRWADLGATRRCVSARGSGRCVPARGSGRCVPACSAAGRGFQRAAADRGVQRRPAGA